MLRSIVANTPLNPLSRGDFKPQTAFASPLLRGDLGVCRVLEIFSAPERGN